MSLPQRIQLRRTKGWRKPPSAIVVARPSKWGNPFTVDQAIGEWEAVDEEHARDMVIDLFGFWLEGKLFDDEMTEWWLPRRLRILEDLHQLAGHDLACWCRLEYPCHADVLLGLANAEPSR